MQHFGFGLVHEENGLAKSHIVKLDYINSVCFTALHWSIRTQVVALDYTYICFLLSVILKNGCEILCWIKVFGNEFMSFVWPFICILSHHTKRVWRVWKVTVRVRGVLGIICHSKASRKGISYGTEYGSTMFSTYLKEN